MSSNRDPLSESSMADFQRVLDFDQVMNMRDFGGYAGEFGWVVARRLFRSAHLSNANAADLNRLAALDVGLIVDLRYLSERERQPNKWPESRSVKTLAFDARVTGIAPHELFMEHELKSAADARGYMMNNYAERPRQPEFQAICKSSLEHLAQTGDGVIVHCAAGKDRTGTLVALIQAILGLTEDDILADYMLTLDAVDIDAILVPASKMISKRYGRDYTPEMLRPMFGVEPDYLQAMLEVMGNPQDYARQTLGLSDDMLAQLRAHYIAN